MKIYLVLIAIVLSIILVESRTRPGTRPDRHPEPHPGDIHFNHRPHPLRQGNLPSRIVGGWNCGSKSEDGQCNEDWVASMQTSGNWHYCGGSLVSPTFVLTAAHCTGYGISHVELGNYNQNTAGGKKVNVIQEIPHPNYDSSTLNNDFALLRLETPVDDIEPIEMNFGNDAANNEEAELIATLWGWGATSEGGAAASFLQEVQVPVVSNTECNNLYGGSITNEMICAGLVGEGGKDACQGDSGGPMVVNNKLVGATSWGIGCARPNYPGVYSRISQVQQWIEETLESTCDDNGCGGGGGSEVPDGWSCADSWYGDGQYCDCNCGAYDSDCDSQSSISYGCPTGEVCMIGVGECSGNGGGSGSGTNAPSSSGGGSGNGGVPDGWTCSDSWYGDGQYCDCNCGAYDSDCDSDFSISYGCPAGEVCMIGVGECSGNGGGTNAPSSSGWGSGSGNGEVPDEWTCTDSYYNDGAFCDCNCGAYDPDCDEESSVSWGCPTGEVCMIGVGECSGGGGSGSGSGSGIGPITSAPSIGIVVPDEWFCRENNYGTNDGCDCNCGAYDPDCANDATFSYGCKNNGECDLNGECEFDCSIFDNNKKGCKKQKGLCKFKKKTGKCLNNF